MGSVLAGGGVGLMSWGSWAIGFGNADSGINGSIEKGIGILSMIAGVILLDGDSGHDLVFAAVSPQDAQKIGLTAEEAQSFNLELPEVNAVRESIQSEVASDVKGGKRLADVDVHAKWENYRDMLSPVTFSALEKVSAHVIDNLKQAAQ